MGSNPVGASDFLLAFICNCLSYFITARITYTCILYPQCKHMIFILYTSLLHCIIISSLSHYSNVLFAGEDEDVACPELLVLSQ